MLHIYQTYVILSYPTVTALPECSFLDPSGWQRIDVELELRNDLHTCNVINSEC
jgi:hypothetical protein